MCIKSKILLYGEVVVKMMKNRDREYAIYRCSWNVINFYYENNGAKFFNMYISTSLCAHIFFLQFGLK